MNKIPAVECAACFEDFSVQERALDCPTCLVFQVYCLGNFHKKREQLSGNYLTYDQLFDSFNFVDNIKVNGIHFIYSFQFTVNIPFIVPFSSLHIFYICNLFALDEFHLMGLFF